MWGERGRLWLTTKKEFPGIILRVRVGGEGPPKADHNPLRGISRHHSPGACGGRGAAYG